MDINHTPSPNFGPRKAGVKPSLIVIHYTAMGDAQSALRRLCQPDAQVSAHYLISEEGVIYHLVDEQNRAWHAGAGQWCGIDDVNSHSIGIELANATSDQQFIPFSAGQMDALEALLPAIMARWHIPAKGVIAHSDCALGRKIDPGPKFDWQRLARQGLAYRPQPIGSPAIDQQAFCASLRRYGYGVDGVAFGAVLNAFRMRFCPQKRGPLDKIDMALAAGLGAQ